MELYKFFHKRRKWVVLTTDADAGNLPVEAKEWTPKGKIEIRRDGPARIGFPNDQILDSIEKIGYFPPILDS